MAESSKVMTDENLWMAHEMPNGWHMVTVWIATAVAGSAPATPAQHLQTLAAMARTKQTARKVPMGHLGESLGSCVSSSGKMIKDLMDRLMDKLMV